MLTTFRKTRQPVPPEPIYDRRGFYRSPVTLASYRQGKAAPNKGMKYPIEVLTPQEVDALLRVCGHGLAGWRNRALIITLYRGGLRISEALALMPKDIDLDTGRVTILRGKGSKRRMIALDPGACAIVARWMDVRAKLGITRSQPLFCVISQPTLGLPIGSAYVRELLKKLAAKAGIEKRVHPHGLRHSYASYLADQGVPLKTIQTMLGHSSVGITDRYMHDLNPAGHLDLVRSLEWPS
jgi:site-specific recombinase XerD